MHWLNGDPLLWCIAINNRLKIVALKDRSLNADVILSMLQHHFTSCGTIASPHSRRKILQVWSQNWTLILYSLMLILEVLVKFSLFLSLIRFRSRLYSIRSCLFVNTKVSSVSIPSLLRQGRQIVYVGGDSSDVYTGLLRPLMFSNTFAWCTITIQINALLSMMKILLNRINKT
jgi:hypothetical protein